MRKITHHVKKHYNYHKHYIPHYFVFVFYTLAILFGLYTLFPTRVVAETAPQQKLDGTVVVDLWGFVDRESLSVHSNFDTPLQARLKSVLSPLKSQLEITPQDLLYPNTEYIFEIETKNWLGFKSTRTVRLTTQSLPRVTLSKDFPDRSQVPADTSFNFNIDSNLSEKYFEFRSEPSFGYDKQVTDNILVVKPKNKLLQGVDYSFSVFLKSQTLDDRLLYSDSFSVIDPLEIVGSTPANNASSVAKQTKIEIVFSKEVVADTIEAKVKIEPDFTKTLNWKDSKTLLLTPHQPLQTGTKFTLTLSDQIKGTDNSQLAETKTLAFTTAGIVKVVGFSPNGSDVSPASTINVTFDQPVDQTSAQTKFSLNPTVAGSFSWSGNTLSYKTSGLGLSTPYTVTIATGVKSLGGEDSIQGFNHQFTTTSERSRTIGYSVRGRALTATYFGTGPKRILLIGTLHGSETNTGNMLSSWINYLRNNQSSISSDRTFIIVPYANPDGRTSNFRFNANNVDLNRNFGTPDWQALSYWQNRSYPSGGGSGPFSEPESRALRDLILGENITHIITYHSNANMVLGDGIANSFGDWYANLTGYTRIKGGDEERDGVSALGYVITGTLEEWATLQGKVTLVIEFISQTANEYNRNLPALKGLLNYPI